MVALLYLMWFAVTARWWPVLYVEGWDDAMISIIFLGNEAKVGDESGRESEGWCILDVFVLWSSSTDVRLPTSS